MSEEQCLCLLSVCSSGSGSGREEEEERQEEMTFRTASINRPLEPSQADSYGDQITPRQLTRYRDVIINTSSTGGVQSGLAVKWR